MERFLYRRVFCWQVSAICTLIFTELPACGFRNFSRPESFPSCRRRRTLCWLAAAAAAMVYAESWLPGLESIKGNFHNLEAMGTSYPLESAYNFLNFEMIGVGILLIIAYYGLKDYVRISTFTLLYLFLLLICGPIWQPWFEKPAEQVVVAQTEGAKEGENGGGSIRSASRRRTVRPTKIWISGFMLSTARKKYPQGGIP